MNDIFIKNLKKKYGKNKLMCIYYIYYYKLYEI